MLINKYKIKNLQQTRDKCEFECNGKKYHGICSYIQGVCHFLYSFRRKWEIFDENNVLVTVFAVESADSPINKKYLSQCVKDFEAAAQRKEDS